MAESTLSSAYNEIRAIIGRFLGHGADPSAWGSVSTPDTYAWIIERVLESGLRKFANPPKLPGETDGHSWNFLRVPETLTTKAAFGDGTVAVTNGDATVTITGGVLPQWIAVGVFTYLGRTYGIATRTDDTHFELDEVFPGTTASGGTYSITQRDYDMPDDFGFVVGPLTYQPNVYLGDPISVVGEAMIRELRQRQGSYSGRPLHAAVQAKKLVDATTEGQRQQIMFWPTPDAEYALGYTYFPLIDKPTSSSIYTYGGMAHNETLIEACLCAAEERENEERGVHYVAFMERLAASIAQDRRTQPHSLGINGDNSGAIAGGHPALRQSFRVPEYRGPIWS